MPNADIPETEMATTPSEQSVASILFFDGVCGLCNRFVDFAIVRDSRRLILFAPLQGETAVECLSSSDRERLDTVVFLNQGKAYRRSAAIVRLFWNLGGIWKIAAALLWLIPRPIRDVAYRMISRTRYRFFGRKEACRLPTAAERGRFLP